MAHRPPSRHARHLAGHLKKGSGQPHLPYNDIVEEALCFGWVDSRPRSIGADRSALLVTPRKPSSNWSRPNKQRVAKLTAAGLMRPAGLAAVAAAQANGSWDALDHVEDLTEPVDLPLRSTPTPAARQNWDAFPRSARRAILEWIGNAKTSATRQAWPRGCSNVGSTTVGAASWSSHWEIITRGSLRGRMALVRACLG